MKTHSLKQRISSFLVKFLTKKSLLIKKEVIDSRYIDLTIILPRNVKWTRGDKVQFLINDNELRSYTPYAFREDGRTFSTLIYDNQIGEGASFIKSLKTNDRLKVLGPRASLNGEEMKENAIFFADESSIGLAFALKSKIKLLFLECHHQASFKPLVKNKFLFEDAFFYQRQDNGMHLIELAEKISKMPKTFPIYLSGNKENILKLQELLENNGVSGNRIHKKFYWGLITRRSSRKNAANS